MSFIGKAIGKLTGAGDQAKAAQQAAATQSEAAKAGIAAVDKRFEAMQELLSPFTKSGVSALGAQQNLLGLSGPEAQQQAISGIESSPMFNALAQQGESALLQNASATGGIRGGNTQAALAQFRPQMLNQLLEQQYQRLGGLTQLGQASAAGVGTAGIQAGQSTANLLQQSGAATAGGQIAAGNVASSGFGTLGGLAGAFIGAGGLPGIKGLF